MPQRSSCHTFSSTPLSISLNLAISLCSSMLLTAKSASLSQRTFSGRSLPSCPCVLQAGTDSPRSSPPVNDRNWCISTPAPFTLKGDNVEANIGYNFPKFSHRIKFQLSTMIAYSICAFCWLPSLPCITSFHFCPSTLPQGPLLRELCIREGSSAVWKVEAYWRTLG